MSDVPAPRRVRLSEDELARLLADVPGPGGQPWRVRVVDSAGSTNADLVARVRAAESAGTSGEAPGQGGLAGEVLVAEEQKAGRGRLGRTWTAPARSALTFSAVLHPGDGVADWGWLPLLVGVAVADAVRSETGVPVGLKWPNDLVLPDADADADRKLGGVLVERVGGAAVVGVGLNVSLTVEELPVPTATSLLLAGAGEVAREPLLVAGLAALAGWDGRWQAVGGDAGASGLHTAYVQRCVTLGRAVAVHLPGGGETRGTAVAVDPDGQLVLDTGQGRHPVAAGDVWHVR
ncbi:MAG: biotin--[acetyl-CoA-carboxylase] ligase [Actinomycetes bacterium]